MENKSENLGHRKEEFEHDCGNIGMLAPGYANSITESKFTTIIRRFSSKQSFKIMSAESFRSCNNDYLVLSSRDLQNWIPKSMVTVDEKYLRQCLKLISSKTISSSVSPFGLDNHLLSDSVTLESQSMKKLCLNEDDESVTNSFSSFSPQKQPAIGRKNPNFDPSHQPIPSTSSSNLSISGLSKKGIVQCVWKGEIPHFVFSFDDRKLVYTARMEIGASALDFVYIIQENGDKLVGKMRVSSSFILCADQSRILEREFVLFGVSEASALERPNHYPKKNKGFLKTIGHSTRKKTASFPDYCKWEPTQTENNDLMTSNFELVAVVVKDNFSCSTESLGGWGLKFLKDVEFSDSSASSLRQGSTDVDVIVPAGYHGGPTKGNSGPSSLTERWKSGGVCDCGGWDLGCSLTILKGRSNSTNSSCSSHGSSKMFELVAEGSLDGIPYMRVANVQEGLYLVDYQSNISALQVFAILVANIHAQSSILLPKMYRN